MVQWGGGVGGGTPPSLQLWLDGLAHSLFIHKVHSQKHKQEVVKNAAHPSPELSSARLGPAVFSSFTFVKWREGRGGRNPEMG